MGSMPQARKPILVSHLLLPFCVLQCEGGRDCGARAPFKAVGGWEGAWGQGMQKTEAELRQGRNWPEHGGVYPPSKRLEGESDKETTTGASMTPVASSGNCRKGKMAPWILLSTRAVPFRAREANLSSCIPALCLCRRNWSPNTTMAWLRSGDNRSHGKPHPGLSLSKAHQNALSFVPMLEPCCLFPSWMSLLPCSLWQFSLTGSLLLRMSSLSIPGSCSSPMRPLESSPSLMILLVFNSHSPWMAIEPHSFDCKPEASNLYIISAAQTCLCSGPRTV